MRFKNVYPVSLCKNGILGGILYLLEGEMVYCTNKLTVKERFRRLHLPYSDIAQIRKEPFHTVTVHMKKGETYRFLVFSPNGLLKKLQIKMQENSAL